MAEKKKELHLLRHAESFDDALVNVSAHAPKKFRNNIVHDLQITSENIVKSIFWANEYRQYDIQECLKYTKQAEIRGEKFSMQDTVDAVEDMLSELYTTKQNMN